MQFSIIAVALAALFITAECSPLNPNAVAREIPSKVGPRREMYSGSCAHAKVKDDGTVEARAAMYAVGQNCAKVKDEGF